MLNGEWFHDEVGTSKTARPSLMTKKEVCDLINMIHFEDGSVLNIFVVNEKSKDLIK
jgi:hypothetical protein